MQTTGIVYDVDFGADDRALATDGDDGIIRRWPLPPPADAVAIREALEAATTAEMIGPKTILQTE